ncbi:MAG: hypothetical protein IJ405_03735 [Lachnospiraceae bacterium]|nr:hypothetical protein [Lachnospiraceae bacterium]MBQ7781115.1 hypothetical protein [Lachnospiraceae bacterium]
MNTAKNIFRRAILFMLCGSAYYCIELLWRGHSHISMLLLAGFLGVFCIDAPNNIWGYELDYLVQIGISTLLCTLGEGIVGLIVNIWLGLKVWDYSELPFTFFWGQCNIFFVVAWILLIGLIGIPVCDAYWYYICKDSEQPYYKICGKYIFRMPQRKE